MTHVHRARNGSGPSPGPDSDIEIDSEHRGWGRATIAVLGAMKEEKANVECASTATSFTFYPQKAAALLEVWK